MSALPRTGLRLCGRLVVTACVVLAARALAYSLEPRTPLGARLAGETGGPSVLALGLALLVLAFAASAVIVATAALAVAERSRLEPLAISASSRIRPWHVAGRAVVLWLASSTGFVLLESYIHWRAGLGWHGLRCLLGPVHRDAVPFLAALSLVASAVVAAAGHVLGWLRRVVRRVAAQVPAVWPSALAPLSTGRGHALPAWSGARPGARAPPRPLLVLQAAPLACALQPTRRTHT